MSFWSLVLDYGKKYEKTVENGIQVTRATLDTSRVSNNNDGIVQVILEYEGTEITVANLSVKHGIFQTTLDLTFREGDRVAFSTSGAKIPVSLTGIAGMDADEDDLDDEELEDLDEDYMESLEEEGEDSDEEVDDGPMIGKKRKLEVAEKFKRPSKSAKMDASLHKALATNGESFPSDDDEDEDEPYNPTVDMSSMGEDLLGDDEEEEVDDEDSDMEDEEEVGSEDELASDDDDDDEEGEEEEEEDDSSEEESEEEEAAKPVVESKKAKMNGAPEHMKKKDLLTSANGTPKQAKQVEKLKSAGKDNKTPNKDGKTPVKGVKTPGKDAKDTPAKDAKSPKAGAKEVKTPKPKKSDNKENIDKTPKSEKKKQQKEANKGTPAGKQEASGKKQMRAGGVMIEDISVGSGEAARKGSQVSMYYVGRLQRNNKQFDACQSGQPLKFVLGRGEVIQGWDVGVMGMKVGGKRKLSIPSSMAYGKRGAPPAIPPQSNLEFTVTLMGCR